MGQFSCSNPVDITDLFFPWSLWTVASNVIRVRGIVLYPPITDVLYPPITDVCGEVQGLSLLEVLWGEGGGANIKYTRKGQGPSRNPDVRRIPGSDFPLWPISFPGLFSAEDKARGKRPWHRLITWFENTQKNYYFITNVIKWYFFTLNFSGCLKFTWWTDVWVLPTPPGFSSAEKSPRNKVPLGFVINFISSSAD